ncbi:hypothetical protein HPP92_003477 [Vanilla planifolia]|uniref:Scarecrow-like protein 8 n=1 Tax=Vanilla planifolia TaxID=51239 RepID=A0A835RUZ1_VANPL|nr:hypothetical protein HPP92_003477 [Vanilla planifolia]
MLYEASPCFKLGTVAANLAILEATKDYRKIHILDFNVGHGGNLASLIYAISERHRYHDPPSLKITAVCDPSFLFSPISATGSANNLKLVGDRLVKLADRLGIGLRFRIVNRGTHELDQKTLQCEPEEALAVNLAYILSRVADESVSPSNPRDELLRRVKGLAPKVVTLVEQEMNGNTAPFETRFAEACAHYGALLESFDATVGRESRERARVEYCLAQKAANCVAREGADRVERCEVYGKWRARMSMAGFQPAQLGFAVTNSIKIRLDSFRNNPGFTVNLEDTWIGCGWMDRILTVASAWR